MPDANGETILWQRLDLPGHEHASIVRDGDGWRLAGVAVLAHDGVPCRIEYEIGCDASWMTRTCAIRGAKAARPVHLDIQRNAAGEWTLDGNPVAALRGCADVDLGFSPLTNLLPIRRLALPVGARAEVRAAWVRFPQLTLEVLEQVYARVDETHYQYESAGGAFRRELTVDAFGCVIEYPGIWRAEATA